MTRAVAAALLASCSLLAGHAAVASAAGQPAGAQERPACFGAAARDPLKPCDARALRLRVTPTPIEAVLAANAPCSPGPRIGLVSPCVFGTAATERPAEELALLGDSHAVHWRAALRVAAVARRARGTSITRTGCPFTREPLDLPAAEAAECRRWNRGVVAYLEAHPEITTVVISSRSGQRVVGGRERVRFSARARGRAKAIRALPASVRHVVVVRDVPVRKLRTLDCIDRAMEQRRPVGTACAVPRTAALREDPTIDGAAQVRSVRVHEVDLSYLMCSARLCFPVVGGALVNKDEDHITTVFSESMGPVLLRELDRRVPRAAGA